jgi:hypothetical protein
MSNELTRFDLARAFGANPKLIRFFEQLISEVKSTSSASPDIQSEALSASHYTDITLIELMAAMRMAEAYINQLHQIPILTNPPDKNPAPYIDLTSIERRLKTIEEFLGL